MLRFPAIFVVSLCLVIATCSDAAVVKRFLPRHPTQGYMHTFPWGNFFNKNNEVSSSESLDDDNTQYNSLEEDNEDDLDKEFDPDDLYNSNYADESIIKGTADDDEINTDDIDETGIDDSYLDHLIVNDLNIDESDIGYSDIGDSDTDDLDTDDSDTTDSEIDDSDEDTDPHIDDVDDDDEDELADRPVDNEYLNDEEDDTVDDSEENLERERRSIRPWMLRLTPAAYKGIMARSYLLKGAVATPARNHGLTSHYEKAGGKNAMLRDFYGVQPTKISDDLIDGHYVGKIGEVGDTRVHYFLHDDEHVELKPLLSITKLDKNGDIIAKDIIHYMD